MFEFIYEWIQNLAYYLVLVTAFLHMVPGSSYKKYIRFFTGIVLVILLIAPVFQLAGHMERLDEILQAGELKQQIEEIEYKQEEKKNEIVVEDISIGHESMASEDKGEEN